MKRAQAILAATQAAIYQTALPLYKKYFPSAQIDNLEDKKKVITAVLDKLAESTRTTTPSSAIAKRSWVSDHFVKSHDLVSAQDAARCDRDAGVQAWHGYRLLRFAWAIREKQQNIFRGRTDTED